MICRGILLLEFCHRIKKKTFRCNVFAFPGRILSKFILLGKESLKRQNGLTFWIRNPSIHSARKNFNQSVQILLISLPDTYYRSDQPVPGRQWHQTRCPGSLSSPVSPQTTLHLDGTWSCQHLFLLLFPQTSRAQISSPRKPGTSILGDIDVSCKHTDPEPRNCWLRAEKNGHHLFSFRDRRFNRQTTKRGGGINRRGTFVFVFLCDSYPVSISLSHTPTNKINTRVYFRDRV